MKQFKKLLSMVLAIIMILSSVSVIASAYGAAWKDSAITRSQYNSIDKPTLTTEQYATAALDEVDRMLDEEQMIFTEDDIIVGTIDLRSINSTLSSVKTLLTGNLWKTAGGLVGDLGDLSIAALLDSNGNALQRNDTDGSDIAIINALLKFLYDNKNLFVDFVEGNLNLGTIVGQFVDLSDFSVEKLAKDALYEAVYKPADAPDSGVTQTVDEMAQELINKLLITGYDGDEPLLPGVTTDDTNISTGTMLSFLDNALKIAYNEYLVPRANNVWLDDIDEMLADNAEEIEKYKSYLNITDDGKCNFTFQTFDFDDDKLVLEQLNDILGSIVNLALNDDIGFEWESGDNSMILTNIINIGKEVLCATGDEFFQSYIEIKTPAELEEMDNMQIVAYVARTILNSSIDGLWIPNTAEDLVSVANYTVKGLMATQLPGRDYSSESQYPMDDINTAYTILADYAVKALNDNPGLNLNYGIGLDAVATAGANWAIDKFGGLLSGVTLSTSKTGWANLDTLVFSIFNRNWIDASKFSGGVTFETLLKDGILGNILNLKLDEALELLTYKGTDSEFNNCTPKQFILNFVTRTLNIVFPGMFTMETGDRNTTKIKSLEGILAPEVLGTFVNAVFSDLYNYRSTLAAAILPIVTDALDLTSAETFKTPEFDLEPVYIRTSGSIDVSFDITNRSYGINTGYTNQSGIFTQDALYKLNIKNVTADARTTTGASKTVTVEQPSKKLLSGGESATVKLSGSVTGAYYIVVNVEYDILKEDGQTLTSNPLTARLYTTVSKTASDESKEWETSSGTFLAKGGNYNLFVTDPGQLDDLEFKIQNKGDSDATIKATSASNGTSALYKDFSTISFLKVNPDAKTVISKGSTEIKPYVLDGYLKDPGKDAPEEEKAAKEAQDLAVFTDKGYQRYTSKVGVAVNGAASPTITQASTICLYKDFGLNSLFNREVNAQRQSFDYDATAFDNYITEMKNASTLVNAVKMINTWCGANFAGKFEAQAASLKTAVEELEATATGDITNLQNRLAEIDPSNAGLKYDEAGYSFFSADNYMTYTWSNFRSEYKAANKFVNSYVEPIKDEAGNEIPNPDKPSALDLAYKTWRLNNYYSRLRSVTTSKVNLNRAYNEAVAKNYVEDDYTETSWANYQRALTFALATKNDTTAVQNKVNVAYLELIEAQKRLETVGGDEPAEVVIEAAEVNPYNEDYAPVIFENDDGETLIYGIAPEDEIDDISLYFSASDGVTFECDAIATGETIYAYDSEGNEVGEYIIVIKGDANGDGGINSLDLSTVLRHVQDISYLSDSGVAAKDFAADLNYSGDVTSLDLSSLLRHVQDISYIDFAENDF